MMIDYYEPKLDLTLLGCGFLGNYHLGAIYLLSQIWPHKPFNRICGASCGGLLGVLVVSGLKLDRVLDNALDILRQLRAFLKSPTQISLRFSIAQLVEKKLDKMLPKNAHELCTDRLGISLTKIWSLENKFISKFNSRRDLIDAICAGCFIPIWSGSLVGPTLNGEHFIDGAYSDNHPKFKTDDNLLQNDMHGRKNKLTVGLTCRQVEVSPFAGKVEVSPKGESYLFKARAFGTVYLGNWNNLLRTTHAMLPFSPETYKPYLLSGHHDMKEYLLRNNLIKCRKCYLSQEEVVKNRTLDCETTTDDTVEPRPGEACLFCLKLLEQVDNLRVSDEMLKVFDD